MGPWATAVEQAMVDQLAGNMGWLGTDFAGIGTHGASLVWAFDPLEKIADVCTKHGVWLHVDAAHGGAALLSTRHRHLVAGLERADSLTWDAHKMLFVPALCAFLFYKNKRHSYDAF